MAKKNKSPNTGKGKTPTPVPVTEAVPPPSAGKVSDIAYEIPLHGHLYQTTFNTL